MSRPPRRGVVDTRTRVQVFQSFLAGLVPWLLLAGLLAMMWPVRFGGTTNFIIVSGRSMERTYHTGDLVITKKRSSYAVGDVVVYRIPGAGAGAGREIVHRLHERLPDGRFLVRGDNNRTNDPWVITIDDIVGSKWLMVAKGGVFLGFLRSTLMLAVLFGVLVAWVFWPREDAALDVETAGERLEPRSEPAHEPHWLDDDAIVADWETLLAPRSMPIVERPTAPRGPSVHATLAVSNRSTAPAVRTAPAALTAQTVSTAPAALHWLDDDGIPDIWLAEAESASVSVSVSAGNRPQTPERHR